MKKNEVARGVRVKLNSEFKINSLSDRYLACEPVLFIDESHVYNDVRGDYVFIKGGSFCNSGEAYLNEIDAVYPAPEMPLYAHDTIDYSKPLI